MRPVGFMMFLQILSCYKDHWKTSNKQMVEGKSFKLFLSTDIVVAHWAEIPLVSVFPCPSHDVLEKTHG